MEGVGIVGLGSYMPAKRVGVDAIFGDERDPLADSPLLRLPENRHHVARDERAAEMVEKAARPLLERHGIDPETGIDVVITNVLLPDIPITGIGAEVAQRLGSRAEWIIDLHNGGCASFPYMLKLAGSIVRAGGARTALLCNVQNTAGQVFSQPAVRKRRHAAAAGDGCGVTLLAADAGSPVLAVATRNDPQCAMDMGLALPDGRKYWEPGESQSDIWFDPNRFKEIIDRGNRLVPELVREVCEQIDAEPADIDVLITNQPNRMFLRNWREALGVPEERHVDTFDRFGNLYGAGAPVTLAAAAAEGRLHDGALVVLAGFAHAGDFAAAAALRWRDGGAGGAGAGAGETVVASAGGAGGDTG